MTTTGKILIGGAALTVLFAGLSVRNAYNIGNQARFVPSVRIHNIDEKGLSINCNIKVANPTNSSIDVNRNPYLELYLKNGNDMTLLGVSEPSDEIATIKGNAISDLGDSLLTIPISKLLVLADQLVSNSWKIKVVIVAKVNIKLMQVGNIYLLPISKKIEKEEELELPSGLKKLLNIF